MNMQASCTPRFEGEIFGWGGLGNPFILTQFVGFAVFMIAVQAELTQTPFDMPIAESELVSGYMTEYSGFRFLLFFIGEFATAGIFAFLRRRAVPRRGWYVPPGFGLDTCSTTRTRTSVERRSARSSCSPRCFCSPSSSTGSGSRYPRFR